MLLVERLAFVPRSRANLRPPGGQILPAIRDLGEFRPRTGGVTHALMILFLSFIHTIRPKSQSSANRVPVSSRWVITEAAMSAARLSEYAAQNSFLIYSTRFRRNRHSKSGSRTLSNFETSIQNVSSAQFQ